MMYLCPAPKGQCCSMHLILAQKNLVDVHGVIDCVTINWQVDLGRRSTTADGDGPRTTAHSGAQKMDRQPEQWHAGTSREARPSWYWLLRNSPDWRVPSHLACQHIDGGCLPREPPLHGSVCYGSSCGDSSTSSRLGSCSQRCNVCAAVIQQLRGASFSSWPA